MYIDFQDDRSFEFGGLQLIEEMSDVEVAFPQWTMILMVAYLSLWALPETVVQVHFSQTHLAGFQRLVHGYWTGKVHNYMASIKVDRQIKNLGSCNRQVEGKLDRLNSQLAGGNSCLFQDPFRAFSGFDLKFLSHEILG